MDGPTIRWNLALAAILYLLAPLCLIVGIPGRAEATQPPPEPTVANLEPSRGQSSTILRLNSDYLQIDGQTGIDVHVDDIFEIVRIGATKFTLEVRASGRAISFEQVGERYDSLIHDVLKYDLCHGEETSCVIEAHLDGDIVFVTLKLNPRSADGGFFRGDTKIEDNSSIAAGTKIGIRGFDVAFVAQRMAARLIAKDDEKTLSVVCGAKGCVTRIPDDAKGDYLIAVCLDESNGCSAILGTKVTITSPEPERIENMIRYAPRSKWGRIWGPRNGRPISRSGRIYVWAADTTVEISIGGELLDMDEGCWFDATAHAAADRQSHDRGATPSTTPNNTKKDYDVKKDWGSNHPKEKERIKDKKFNSCTEFKLKRNAMFKKVPNFGTFTVDIELTKEDQKTSKIKYTLNKHDVFVAYRSLGGLVPVFWIPIGLFGTNFRPLGDQTGIPIAAFPIGLAAGGKFEISREFYIGTSGFANWSIQPRVTRDGEAQPYPGNGSGVDPSAQKGAGEGQFGAFDNGGSDITLKAMSVGGLVDVAGYVYLGGGVALDFTTISAENVAAPVTAPVFVFGLGPELFMLLRTDKRS
jgi:hypothetical protein